jgi:hypothetical protein
VLGSQAAYQCFAEVPGTAGDENCHGYASYRRSGLYI